MNAASSHDAPEMAHYFSVTRIRPQVGWHITVRGTECRIVKVLPAGTIDVESLDGKHDWRVSGLAFPNA